MLTIEYFTKHFQLIGAHAGPMSEHESRLSPFQPKQEDVMMVFAATPPALLRLMLVAVLLFACSPSKPGSEESVLIRVADRTVTVAEFQRAFEVAKAAYSHNIIQNPEDYREAQLRLLNQMTEELILLERAEELNVTVEEDEVEQTIAEIKSDYPDEVFDEMLLEYAVSYKAWKESLRTRLLMEKLVEQELDQQVTITPEEIAKYYREHYGEDSVASGNAMTEHSREIDEIIVKQLRRQKIEQAYKDWIEEIQKQYSIEIDQDHWEQILSS
jgi:hypothetical protein